MKAAEHKSAAISTIQKKSNTPFFDTEHASEQESPFFAPQEASGTDTFFQPATRPTIQTKLTVGQPNDKYEQEADNVADKVVQRLAKSDESNHPSPIAHRPSSTPSVSEASTPIIQHKTEAPEEEKLDRKEENKEELPELQKSPVSAVGDDEGLQMKCAECDAEEDSGHVQMKGNTEGVASSNIESQLNSSKGGGSPLPDETRTSMESAMGADFSNVRVHTGSNAVQMSQDLNAQAFTHGSDVYFNEGKYNPSGTEGGRLLAHELVHTVQQGAAIKRKLSFQNIERNYIQRQDNSVDIRKQHEEALSKIQGHAMFNLLPLLEGQSADVKTDEAAGSFVGGPRLVTAMRVVREKGKQWLNFATTNNGELAALPSDQISDIMHYLGAPKDARYYKADEFSGRFDAAVDPTSASITLFFRVRFEVDGAQFGSAKPGTDQWQKETAEGMRKYKEDYKKVVENIWSGKGKIKPTCAVPGIVAFETKVVVTVVTGGEHKLIHILPDTPGGRSNMGSVGAQKVDDNQPKTNTRQAIDPKTNKPVQTTNTQITSAHEFGHAIGLDHVRCPGDDNCYGVTPEENQDVMGRGDKLQVYKRNGQVKHDDFKPFKLIAERWGKDIFPAALVKCNSWENI